MKVYKFYNQKLDFLDEKSPLELGFVYTEPKHKSDYAIIFKTASGEEIKKYPINNLVNLIFSKVAYEKNKHKLNKNMQKIVESNLGKKLDLYGINHDYKTEDVNNVYNLKKTDEVIVEEPKPPTEFAYKGKLPIDTKENLLKSAEEFLKQIKFLSFRNRKIIALKLVRKAKMFGVELPKEIYEYASFKPKKKQEIKVAMLTRYNSYPEKIKIFVNEMIKEANDIEDYLNLIDSINIIDTELGLNIHKHADLSKEFFSTPNEKDLELNNNINVLLENKILDEYLTPDVVENLKKYGSFYFHKLNPNVQNLIKDLSKKIKK